ncbi:hypothetical protein GWK47_028217 [Chionoecetes opilio]|uniref:Uncharacterized protein n=1 Tax=Chionoecetes opilio TaxID=41210 RepID=A0A8J5D2K4_CHIOP|nr:hypothetical protein GWK47_028217 [Chionoecetes opilio]
MVSLSGLKGRCFSMVLRMWPVEDHRCRQCYVAISGSPPPRAKETVISGLCLFPLWFYKFLWLHTDIYFTAPWQRLGTRLPVLLGYQLDRERASRCGWLGARWCPLGLGVQQRGRPGVPPRLASVTNRTGIERPGVGGLRLGGVFNGLDVQRERRPGVSPRLSYHRGLCGSVMA